MTSITIPAYKSFLYREVHIVTQYKDDCVYKTKATGKYILAIQEKDLPKDHITSSVSTYVYADKNQITLPLFFE